MFHRLLPIAFVALATVFTSACSSGEEAVDESGDELNQSSSDQLDKDFAKRTPCKKASPSDSSCLSEGEVAALARSAGFPESIITKMVCTARVESAFRVRNMNDKNTNGSVDRGLFQVNSIHIGDPIVNPTRTVTMGCPSTAEGLFDPKANARCALAVYKGQQRGNSDPTFGIGKAWYGYRHFKKQCDAFRMTDPSVASDDLIATDDGSSSSSSGVTATDPTAPIQDPTPSVPKDPPATSTEPGSCYAGTLASNLPTGGCYQRRSDGVWFQCKGGQWFRGVDAAGSSGPFGACEPSFPLQ